MSDVYVSCVISASATEVWQAIRDFNDLPQWHPIVAESRIEAGLASDQVGCIRAFTLKDGGRIREQLLALSDYDYTTSYSILESPMALENYIATLKVSPITETNSAFVEWEAEFDCASDDRDALINQIGQNVFAVGLNALRDKL